jgi:hypothetical protein
MPEGVVYVSSWIDEKLERCFQLMEADSRALLENRSPPISRSSARPIGVATVTGSARAPRKVEVQPA